MNETTLTEALQRAKDEPTISDNGTGKIPPLQVQEQGTQERTIRSN